MKFYINVYKEELKNVTREDIDEYKSGVTGELVHRFYESENKNTGELVDTCYMCYSKRDAKYLYDLLVNNMCSNYFESNRLLVMRMITLEVLDEKEDCYRTFNCEFLKIN